MSRPLACALLAAAMLAPSLAAANDWGIDRQNALMFDSLLNYTAPSAHLGQRRGVFDGGSAVARNRLMSESLWHIVPPSFEAGCGGIDLFAGSFSFISAEQFQQLLRSIAANAAGYAFEVALSAMCPTCVETMEALQKKIQALNQGYASSCQLAKGLVNDVADAFDVAHQDETSLVAMVKGFGDAFETRSLQTGRGPVAQVEANLSEAERAREGLEGNLVWRALRQRAADGWFEDGDASLLEAIMSVTGSVIVGPPAEAPDGEGRSFRIVPLAGNLLGIRDLLWGNRNFEADRGVRDRGHASRQYECDTADADGCLAPRIAQRQGLKGMVQHVRSVLLGEAGRAGLVQKFRLGVAELSPAEKAFLELAPNGLGAQIRNLARRDAGVAETYAEQAAPVIALDLVEAIMRDLVRAAENAVAMQPSPYIRQVLDQIERAKAQLHREYEIVAGRYGNAQTLLAFYNDLVAQMKDPPSDAGDLF